MDPDKVWRPRFPELFCPAHVGYADCDTRYTMHDAPDALVSRLHLVALTADGRVIVCRSDNGWRFLPGGTREPGETLADLARRELMEEAGAELISLSPCFASHRAVSTRTAPWRAHLPAREAAGYLAVDDRWHAGPVRHAQALGLLDPA